MATSTPQHHPNFDTHSQQPLHSLRLNYKFIPSIGVQCVAVNVLSSGDSSAFCPAAVGNDEDLVLCRLAYAQNPTIGVTGFEKSSALGWLAMPFLRARIPIAAGFVHDG